MEWRAGQSRAGAGRLPAGAPWLSRPYALGLAILVVSLAFNALGESLRIVLDPTMKDR